MDKVYVVTSGAYSDYSIDAIFSEEQLAQAFVNIYKRSCLGKYQIEEYELDLIAKQLRKGFGAWWAYALQNGPNVCYAFKAFSTEVKEHGAKVLETDHGKLITYCFARNEKHAQKIAQDRFAKFRAEEEGIA